MKRFTSLLAAAMVFGVVDHVDATSLTEHQRRCLFQAGTMLRLPANAMVIWFEFGPETAEAFSALYVANLSSNDAAFRMLLTDLLFDGNSGILRQIGAERPLDRISEDHQRELRTVVSRNLDWREVLIMRASYLGVELNYGFSCGASRIGPTVTLRLDDGRAPRQ